jgi:hypothetical protein
MKSLNGSENIDTNLKWRKIERDLSQKDDTTTPENKMDTTVVSKVKKRIKPKNNKLNKIAIIL